MERDTMPLEGAIQVHHAVCPLDIPGRSGSFASEVAFESEPETVRLSPVRIIRLAKLSFAGCAIVVRARPAKTDKAIQNNQKCTLRSVAPLLGWNPLFITSELPHTR